ncbi:MAG: acetyl-CoA carboxylase carboxyl transferase subunit alpha [Alphaproteobacteria bacterium TMED87]|nr:acetyl-CoA carboxylase carboxyl transferase subunit alpha [Rhodospirillaceae bacterium]OUV08713.1 MAG: acetyl-CoA carboxylase carboxyl transferase subunit alpha [Alphaproteobacteria bacterium TMED87]
MHFLEFEKPIAELEGRIAELRHVSEVAGTSITDEILKLQSKATRDLKVTYQNLNPWQKTLVARHPDRPHFLDYANSIFTEFIILSGDRGFSDDKAILGGLARFKGRSVMIIGQEKGHDTETRLKHNFGMAKPEGYRKAQRLMKMADHFGIPVITFVDTAGAYPGVGAEERGQSEAIARSIETCLNIRVPLISIIIGEGGSGGAIAISSANKILMLEHSIFSVISPEGCASILWRDGDKSKTAAESLKLTAQDLKKLGLIDDIIQEPVGGAHRSKEEVFKKVTEKIDKNLKELIKVEGGQLRARRREKFLAMGRIEKKNLSE